MTTSAGDTTLRIVADHRGLTRGLQQAEQQSRTSMDRIRQHGVKMGLAIAGIGASISALSGFSIKAASDLEESVNAVNVVFGDAASTIHQFGETSSRSVLLSQASFNQLSAQTGALLTNFGSSTEEAADQTIVLAQRAADLASVFNTDVDQALNAINAALRGETEAIRFYAADVTDASLQNHLLAQGINDSVAAMTIQEKAQLRLQVLLAQTAKVQGDVERTAGSFANTSKGLAAELTNVGAAIGTALIPAVSSILQTVVTLVERFSEWTKNNPTLSKSVFLVVGALGAFLLVAGLALIAASTLAGSLATLGITFGGLAVAATAAWSAITGPFVPLVIAIVAGTALIIANWDKVKAGLRAVWDFMRGAFLPIWNGLVDGWRNHLRPALAELWEALKSIFGGAKLSGEGLSRLATAFRVVKTIAEVVGRILGTYLKSVFTVLGGMIKVVARVLTGDFAGAWEAIQETAIRVVKNIVDLVNRIPGVDIDTSRLDAKLKELQRTSSDTKQSLEGMDAAAGETDDAMQSAGYATSEAAEAAREATPAFESSGQALSGSAESAETYADRLASVREELEDARRQADEAVRIHNDLAASYGEVAEWSDEAAMSIDELAEKLDAEAEAASSAAQKIRELRDANRQFEADRLEAAGLAPADLAVAASEFRRLSSTDRAALLREAGELGLDPVEMLAQQRQAQQQGERAQAEADEKATDAGGTLAETIAAQSDELARAAQEQELLGDESKALELAQLRLGWAVEDNEDATSAYNNALDHSKSLQEDATTSAEELIAANGALTASYQRMIDMQRAMAIAQAGVNRAGGTAGGGSRSRGGGGIGPNFEGRVDPDSVTRGADGRYRDENGMIVEGNTARPNDDGTFTSEGGQTVHTDESGNAYYNEAMTQPVSDELQENIDSQQGMEAGALVRRRPGGVRARIGEGRYDEVVSPIPEGIPALLSGIARLATLNVPTPSLAMESIQAAPIAIENRISLTLGRQQFEDLMLETRESLRLQRRW